MHGRSLVAALALCACSKQAAPVATIAGAILVGGGAATIALSHQHCYDGCVAPSGGQLAGGLMIVIGAPMFVIGGISWLYHIGDPDPPPVSKPSPTPPASRSAGP